MTISSRDNHDAHSTGNAEGEGREDREREREGERRGGKGGEMIRQTEGEGREESEIGEVKTNGLAKYFTGIISFQPKMKSNVAIFTDKTPLHPPPLRGATLVPKTLKPKP